MGMDEELLRECLYNSGDQGSAANVQRLLEKGADANFVEDHKTVLETLVENCPDGSRWEYDQIVALLLLHGAKTPKGNTPYAVDRMPWPQYLARFRVAGVEGADLKHGEVVYDRQTTAPVVPAGLASSKLDIFISFRATEARAQAMELKAALERKGVTAFACEDRIERVIANALDICKVFVAMATVNYGAKGADDFGTDEELSEAINMAKSVYVVRMCPTVQAAEARGVLNRYQGANWMDGSASAPDGLVNDISNMILRGR